MNLALLGKDIKHSQSPAIYGRLLKKVNYNLLDFQTENEVPSLDEIFDKYELNGLNITAPYKSHFFDHVQLKRSNLLKQIGGINCIKKEGREFWGENSDEQAFRYLFAQLVKMEEIDKVILLGDGTMAKMINIVIEDYPVDLRQFSRKSEGNIDYLDVNIFDHRKCLMINACSRNYVYKGPFNSNIIFWDMNYSMPEHKAQIPNYIDGESLLELQAEYALKFFNGN